MSNPYVVPFRADLFAGKRALVTGGGTGLGRAVAHRIAQLGGRVVICGRREEIIQATAAEISAATGSEVTSLRCDIRDAATVEKLLFLGVDRCILGTRAAQDRAWAEEMFRTFGERLILGIDAKDGRVAIKGWVETTPLTAVELALALKPAGAQRIIYTDISRDGMLTGPNVAATARLAAETGLAVIASGGMSTLDDLHRLAAYPGIEGAIIGRALYTGAIDLAEAVRAYPG